MAYASIPTVLRPQELMDKAFGRAAKLEAADRNAAHRHRKTVLGRLEAVRNILDDTLGRTVKKFPSLDQIVPYHLDLVRLLIGEDEYRMTLGSVDRTRQNVVELINRTMHQIGKEIDRSILSDTQRRTYGRVSSYLRALDGALARLANYRSTLQRFPAVEPGLHTVVIAGYPNVGKSSLIRALSNAEPEVASYPFTTKSANVGHMFVQRPAERFSKSVVRIQLIDTPGLLDRPGEERNAIEHQATLAIRHLADLVLFLRDRTGHCGYPTDVQDRLLEEVRGLIGDVPLYVIESKTDVESRGAAPHPDTLLSVSATAGIGIPELTEFLVERVTREPDNPALDEFLRGQKLVSYRASPES